MNIMQRVLCAAIVGISALGPAEIAHGSIIPISQDRYVFQSVGEDFFIQNAPDFGLFMSDFGTASQTSTASSRHLSGEGSVGPDDTFTLNSALSYYKLIFDVPALTPFTFTGSLNAGFFGSGVAQFTGPDGDIINYSSSGEESFSWDVFGVLTPGQYTLEVFATVTLSGGLSNWEFDLNMVPGPGVGALIAIGLLGGQPRRRRRM